MVVVAALPAHINHRIDRGAPAEDFTARVTDLPAMEPRIGLCRIAPIGARIANRKEVPDGNVDPEIV